jgi:hypothetical protein
MLDKYDRPLLTHANAYYINDYTYVVYIVQLMRKLYALDIECSSCALLTIRVHRPQTVGNI